MSASLSQALLAFLLIVVAIPVALVMLRRFRMFHPGSRQVLRLTGGISLGPRERIAVVEVGGRWLVVGITGQSINLLTTFDSAPAELTGASSRTGDAIDVSATGVTSVSASAAPVAPRSAESGGTFSRLLSSLSGHEAG